MPHLQKRSVIKIANTSYAIVLPKSWCDYFKIKGKDVLTVISNGNVTILAPTKC